MRSIAEILADDAELRKAARQMAWKDGRIVTKLKKTLEEEETTPYEMYYAYEEAVKNIPPHRILAMNRGENDEVLSVKIEQPEDLILSEMNRLYQKKRSAECQQIFEDAARDGWKRLIGPSIEREIRNDLTEKAEDGAIKVFGKNLHQLLMQELGATGDSKAAAAVYETLSKRLFDDFGIRPNEQTREIYRIAAHSPEDRTLPMEEVLQHIQEPEGNTGAMQCDYDYFKVLCYAESRAMERSGSSA